MSRYARSTLAAGVLIITACQDHPLAVDSLPNEQSLDVVASGAQAQVAGPDDITVDPFRTRLALDAHVDGALTSNATVTLVLEGVATEKLTGGEVRVRLPTMAAMDHAGTDKYPSYPTGKEFPLAARWDLPLMDAGDTWKQQLSIELPDKGYYQVAVEIDARAPDGKASPYVVDDIFEQVWMFVTDDGGFLTHFFDEEVFPEDVVSQPGPFRTKMRVRRAQRAAAMYTAADGDDEDITLEFLYYYNGSHAAEGAYVLARYVSQSDEVGRKVKQYVPENGILTFPCPDENEWVEGSVSVQSTLEVKAGYTIGGFEVDGDDCGTTRQIINWDHIYLPWWNLNEVIEPIDEHFDRNRKIVKWKSRPNENGGSSYNRFRDEITFRGTYYSPWTAAHEYGHALHNKAMGGGWSAGSICTSEERRFHLPTDYPCAFKEGFASYAANVGTDSTDWTFGNYESLHYDDEDDGEEGTIEANIAALFHDLIDGGTETGDRTSYPADYIADVFATCWITNKGGRRFYRNDVTDYVWCLENRVDEDEHEAAFPSVPAPRSADEDADEPDDWNATHIRSTWKKNIG